MYLKYILLKCYIVFHYMTISQFINLLSYWMIFLFFKFLIRHYVAINIFATISFHTCNIFLVIYLRVELLNWRVCPSTLPDISKLLSKVVVPTHMFNSSIGELLLLWSHDNFWNCNNLNFTDMRWYLSF